MVIIYPSFSIPKENPAIPKEKKIFYYLVFKLESKTIFNLYN